jgi:hypothetical protein
LPPDKLSAPACHERRGDALQQIVGDGISRRRLRNG